MSTLTQILYQIVFSTKHREKVLEEEKKLELFKYMGYFKEKQLSFI